MFNIVTFRFKSSISDIYSHKCLKIKVHSDYDLPLEKTLNMHDVVILVESVFNKSDNLYNCLVFLEKFSYKLTCYVLSSRLS